MSELSAIVWSVVEGISSVPADDTSSACRARRKPNWPMVMLRISGSYTSRRIWAVSEYIIATAAIH